MTSKNVVENFEGDIKEDFDVDEKIGVETITVDGKQETPIKSDEYDDEHIIRDGYDVAEYLLSGRDDGDAALTFRSITLGTLGACFQSSMNQVYLFRPTNAGVSGAFLILIIYFIGLGWAAALPKSSKLRTRFGHDPSRMQRALIATVHFINPGPFTLKEHVIASITSSSASNGAEALLPFTVQRIFYDAEFNLRMVIMSLISVALFGYGLAGLFRPFAVYPSMCVFWGNLPMVQLFQKLHWDKVTLSKPLRYFWYAFAVMAAYEVLPAYIAIWLVSVSIPCLAAMHAPRRSRRLLTNLFGGGVSNEGLGLFSLCFDWQYIGSGSVCMPLAMQANSFVGLLICYVVFLALYYGNAFNARHLPFLSTRILTDQGEAYPVKEVFKNGILDEAALNVHGLPKLTATYTWAMMTNNAAIGAQIAHCFFFWRKDVVKCFKEAFSRSFSDRHQRAMEKYKEVHWIWYVGLLFISFVLGLIVNIADRTTLSVGGYLLAVVVGTVLAPFSALLVGRLGSGIATNIVMKMIAGVAMPGKPVANLYFAAWSHAILAQAVALCADLKMGVYLKIPPRVMFFTQVYGTTLGTFINYAVMSTIVARQKPNLLSNNGTSLWTGAFFQSINTQASVWALSKQLYAIGKPYAIVPFGVLIGIGLVFIQWCIHRVKPKFGPIEVKDLIMPYLCLYSGILGYWATQSCVQLSNYIVAAYSQLYLRNRKPRLFKTYSYIVAAGLDGGSMLVSLVLAFAVYGAVSTPHPFPAWFGNPAEGYPDHCPMPDSM